MKHSYRSWGHKSPFSTDRGPHKKMSCGCDSPGCRRSETPNAGHPTGPARSTGRGATPAAPCPVTFVSPCRAAALNPVGGRPTVPASSLRPGGAPRSPLGEARSCARRQRPTQTHVSGIRAGRSGRAPRSTPCQPRPGIGLGAVWPGAVCDEEGPRATHRYTTGGHPRRGGDAPEGREGRHRRPVRAWVQAAEEVPTTPETVWARGPTYSCSSSDTVTRTMAAARSLSRLLKHSPAATSSLATATSSASLTPSSA